MKKEELYYKLTGTENPKFITEREETIIVKCLEIINSSSQDETPKVITPVCVSILTQEVTSKLINEIEQKMNQVITERLKEIVGIDLNIEEEEEEAKRRFKRLAIEYKGNKETIYFNDGSEQVKRIVTFVREEQPPNFEFGKCEMWMGYSYY